MRESKCLKSWLYLFFTKVISGKQGRFCKKFANMHLRRNDQVLAGSHDILVMAVVRVRFFLPRRMC